MDLQWQQMPNSPRKGFVILILLEFFAPHLCLLRHSAICCNKIQAKHFRKQPLHTLKYFNPEHSPSFTSHKL